jgi:iron complex transport system permease protein
VALEIADTRNRARLSEKPAPWSKLALGLSPLVAVLLFVMLVAASVGAVRIPFGAVLEAIARPSQLTPAEHTILFSIRLPRILAAGIVGSALSVSGLLFQGLFRNPLADPYVIGSSGGAVLGASLGVFLLPPITIEGFGTSALLALAGAICSIAFVYLLASVKRRTPVVALLLAGFTVSTMLSYSSYFLEVLDHDFGTGARVLTSWLHGTVSQPTWSQLWLVSGMLVAGLTASAGIARRLNTLALGEEYAAHLGLHVQQTRIAVIIVGSILTAAAVALGGLISFVGLIVPHMMRILVGPDHGRLLPFTALAGAIFLLIADTIARTVIAPAELPVGVLTACVGGPFFLYLLRKSKTEAFL